MVKHIPGYQRFYQDSNMYISVFFKTIVNTNCFGATKISFIMMPPPVPKIESVRITKIQIANNNMSRKLFLDYFMDF